MVPALADDVPCNIVCAADSRPGVATTAVRPSIDVLRADCIGAAGHYRGALDASWGPASLTALDAYVARR